MHSLGNSICSSGSRQQEQLKQSSPVCKAPTPKTTPTTPTTRSPRHNRTRAGAASRCARRSPPLWRAWCCQRARACPCLRRCARLLALWCQAPAPLWRVMITVKQPSPKQAHCMTILGDLPCSQPLSSTPTLSTSTHPPSRASAPTQPATTPSGGPSASAGATSAPPGGGAGSTTSGTWTWWGWRGWRRRRSCWLLSPPSLPGWV